MFLGKLIEGVEEVLPGGLVIVPYLFPTLPLAGGRVRLIPGQYVGTKWVADGCLSG